MRPQGTRVWRKDTRRDRDLRRALARRRREAIAAREMNTAKLPVPDLGIVIYAALVKLYQEEEAQT